MLQLPMIGGNDASAVAVQQLRAAIWVPEEYALIGTPKNFTVETRTVFRELLFARSPHHFGTQDLDGWIGTDAGGVFEFPTEGRRYQYSNLGGRDAIEGLGWWHLPFYTWAVSGMIVVIGYVLRKTPWENKLTWMVIVAFLACAYAMNDVDLVIHALAVSSYGLGVVAVIWLIHALFSHGGALAAAVAAAAAPIPAPTTVPSATEPQSQPPAEASQNPPSAPSQPNPPSEPNPPSGENP